MASRQEVSYGTHISSHVKLNATVVHCDAYQRNMQSFICAMEIKDFCRVCDEPATAKRWQLEIRNAGSSQT